LPGCNAAGKTGLRDRSAENIDSGEIMTVNADILIWIVADTGRTGAGIIA